MIDFCDAGKIRPLMKKYGFTTSHSLGQNFITDPEVCPKMAELCGISENSGVLEIGSGLGVLTAQLAVRAKKVVAVEIDKRLIPLLGETLADFDNISVINADILKLNLREVLDEYFTGMDVVVCANLPYYITTPIIMELLERNPGFKAITVMVQKETGQRICAEIPSREMGAVTVAVRWHSEPRILFEVPKEAFFPQPDVTSSVIRLDMRHAPPVAVKDEAIFFRVVKAAFSQRRKTILNCLSSIFPSDKSEARDALQKIGVSPLLRAEQLKLEDFAAIADVLSD